MMETADTQKPASGTFVVINGGLHFKPAKTLSTIPKPKLLEQVRQTIRTRHYSVRNEKAYIHWIKRFIFFHNKRHPIEMGEPRSANFFQVWQR